MSKDSLTQAFLRTDQSWIDKVDARFRNDPYVAAPGTCCLVGVFWKRNLYLANVGDSRAIIGREVEGSARIEFQQLTRDDNVREPEVRAEVLALHPDEPDFIVKDAKGAYRIKGRIQVSKSIGDAYLKKARFNLNEVDTKFKLNTPVRDDNPAVSADPMTYTIPIGPQDRFVIFASDGLWDMMSNQDAADIVQEHPREGIAERLITTGFTKLAEREVGLSYEEIMDNISVVVIFFDHSLLAAPAGVQGNFPIYSITEGSLNKTLGSGFTILDEIPLSPPIPRTVSFRNLPYHTDMATAYRIASRSGGIQFIEMGLHGFSAKVVFFEAHDATRCVNLNRNRLIRKGKLVCVSLMTERRYRRTFAVVDHAFDMLELPCTVCISNLTDQSITVEVIAYFFMSYGLNLVNMPILHRARNNGRLFAFATFDTKETRTLAESLNGINLLDHYVRIRPRKPPTLRLYPVDLNEDDDV